MATASTTAVITPTTPRPSLPDAIRANSLPEHFWKYCEPVLSGLLDLADGYSAAEKESHLRFFHEHCAQLLGPSPAGKPMKEMMIPLEASVNTSGNREKGVVRFQLEPHSVTDGPHTTVTGDDPFGVKGVQLLLGYLEQVMPGLDFTWSRCMAEKLMVSEPAEVARLVEAEKSSLPVPLDAFGRCPQFNMAIDLVGAKRGMKIYFIPLAKALATGRPALDICFDAIRSLEPYGAELSPAADALQDYLQTQGPGPMTCDYIAVDATDPEKSRVKLYISSDQLNSFDFVRSVYTLGGVAMDETRLKGLEVLRSVWSLLLGADDGELPDASGRPPKTLPFFLGCLYFGFEWRAGDRFPQVKVYIPLWQYHETDRKVAQTIAQVLAKLGQPAMGETYSDRLAKCYGKADWDGGITVHNQVSFAYSADTGAYLSVYYGLRPENIAV